MDMMGIRRRVLEDAPEYKTATGNPLQIVTDRAANAQVVVEYDFTQSGSGTPSPSNIRPISGGVSDVELRIASAQGAQDEVLYSYHLQNAIYAGYFDFNSVAVQEKRMITLDGNAGWAAVGSKFYVTLDDSGFVSSTAKDTDYISNMYQFAEIITSGSAAVTEDKRYYLQRVSTVSWCRVWVYDSAYTLDQFKAMLNNTPLQVTYPITPVYEPHDPITVRTRAGNNYITTNGKNITMQYWSH